VTWQEIAAHFGTVAHPRMEFEPLARRATWNYAPEPGLFDRPPPTDWLPTSVVHDALRVLRRHTATTEQCWFAFWHGYASLQQWIRDAPALRIPDRTYHLLGGTIDDASGVDDAAEEGGCRRAALWWPEDRRWFVGSDTDLMSTYIGGSRALADDLLSSPLEAHEVPTDTSFAWRGDDVNAG